MRNLPLIAAFAFLAAPVVVVPAAGAQAAPPAGHAAHPARPDDAKQPVPRDQSLKMRSEIGELNDRITQAETARRIPESTAGGLRNEIRSIQRTYWSRMRGGMTRGEYGATEAQIARLRGQFEGLLAKGVHPRG